MKKISLFFIVALFSFLVNGQNVLHYEFSNSLSEVNGYGPDLTVLGTTGVYVEDTLLEIGSAEKMVYRFEQNSGFQFDNTAAGNFLGEGYTIELYFVFDNLSSWKRVVDWKNRTSDNGAYVFNGELNFYPYQYSSGAPVNEGEYTYYVITRDEATQELIIYTDAVNHIEFIDTGEDGILNGDNVLNFFHDDLIVGGEASSGAVAMLKLYNYRLDSATIVQHYADLESNVFGIGDPETQATSISIFPNPVGDQFTLDLSAFERDQSLSIDIVNSLGMTVKQLELDAGAGDRINISVSDLEKGLYVLRLRSGNQYAARKILVQ